MAIEVVQVPDAVLMLAAAEKGPSSAEAQVLARLRLLRAKDRQVFAFRLGDYLIAGPVPDARTELAMIEIAEEASE
jgi:hypothetical protein